MSARPPPRPTSSNPVFVVSDVARWTFVIDDFGPGPTFFWLSCDFGDEFCLASPLVSPIAPEKYTGLIILDVIGPGDTVHGSLWVVSCDPEHVEDTAAAGMRLIWLPVLLIQEYSPIATCVVMITASGR